jgi:hypothetical protein
MLIQTIASERAASEQLTAMPALLQDQLPTMENMELLLEMQSSGDKSQGQGQQQTQQGQQQAQLQVRESYLHRERCAELAALRTHPSSRAVASAGMSLTSTRPYPRRRLQRAPAGLRQPRRLRRAPRRRAPAPRARWRSCSSSC